MQIDATCGDTARKEPMNAHEPVAADLFTQLRRGLARVAAEWMQRDLGGRYIARSLPRASSSPCRYFARLIGGELSRVA
jgi:hypothetical protein